MHLFYKSPAKDWEETLPIGNGSLGAMIWGTKDERLGLNHDSLWSGIPRDKNNHEAAGYLEETRQMIWNGEYENAQRNIEKKMLGEYSESYLPLGDLFIHFDHQEIEYEEYERSQNLDEAVSYVSYKCGEDTYQREYFVSYPDQAILIRLSASKANMKVRFHFESQLKFQIDSMDNSQFIKGRCPEHVKPNYIKEEDNIFWGKKGIAFEAACMILSTDGVMAADKTNGLHIEEASEIIAAFTFSGANEPLPAIERVFAKIGYEGIKQRHMEDYKKIFGRVELYLGDQPDIPTDERIRRLKENEDPALYALYFQYVRYLLISSSREGGMPANLQGIWCWQMRPPWGSNYTTNINLQMNYWPAASCNLLDCMEPYFHFLQRLSENGKNTAGLHYGCRGFTVAHNSDCWAMTNPVGVVQGKKEGEMGSGQYAYFPLGGAWLCEELWKYYEYTLDENFLRETAYPILREAVMFCVDWLVEYQGCYVTCPSSSPENKFYIPDGEGKTASMIYACTMDMTIIREVFVNFEKTCKVLEIEDKLLDQVYERREKLYPYKVGKLGQLQEWPLDLEEPEPGHRHVSHLYGLYPSELFQGDKELTDACRITLERRLAHGGGHTGWSCAWIANFFAILEDGEKTGEFLHTLLSRSTYPNLWDAHPPFQIDGNFGGIEAIANALVHDRGGNLKILPALPPQWKNGYVKGLRIKGRKTIDIEWEEGKLLRYQIHSG